MTPPCILVATDGVADGEMVSNLLGEEFEIVHVSTVAQMAAADFDAHRPDVLILAFQTLEATEEYVLELSRGSQAIPGHSYRTVVLCDKAELLKTYEQCRNGRFDDYVLFWPLIHDARRLPMSVTHAYQNLVNARHADAQAVRQAHTVQELERALQAQLAQGRAHADAVDRSLDRTITAADQLKAHEVGQHLRAMRSEVQPFLMWVDEMAHRMEPHISAALALGALEERFQPIVLVVDDSEFDRKMVGKLLEEELCELVYASGGADALAVLLNTRPDLILLDMDMPGINGLETLGRLKNSPDLASIPVVMITGHSERDVVVRCLKAGAVDFAVKPLNRENLLKKIAKFLRLDSPVPTVR